MKGTKQGAKKNARTKSTKCYREKLVKETAKADSLIADWTRDDRKCMNLKKADRTFRLLWENYNSLQIQTEHLLRYEKPRQTLQETQC